MRKIKKQIATSYEKMLVKWLQNYANNYKCHVCVNSDYSPCVIAIWGNPTCRYDEEDGYWYWGCQGKGKFKWIDDEIPAKLKWARFGLMGEKGIIFNPKRKNETVV